MKSPTQANHVTIRYPPFQTKFPCQATTKPLSLKLSPASILKIIPIYEALSFSQYRSGTFPLDHPTPRSPHDSNHYQSLRYHHLWWTLHHRPCRCYNASFLRHVHIPIISMNPTTRATHWTAKVKWYEVALSPAGFQRATSGILRHSTWHWTCKEWKGDNNELNLHTFLKERDACLQRTY